MSRVASEIDASPLFGLVSRSDPYRSLIVLNASLDMTNSRNDH